MVCVNVKRVALFCLGVLCSLVAISVPLAAAWFLNNGPDWMFVGDGFDRGTPIVMTAIGVFVSSVASAAASFERFAFMKREVQ